VRSARQAFVLQLQCVLTDTTHTVISDTAATMVPVRIALLGFSRFERATFESFFRLAGKRTPAYVYTTKVSDCDFLVADADDIVSCATVRLSGIHDRTVMLGNKPYQGAALQLPRPINLMLVIRALDAQPKKAAPPAPIAAAAAEAEAAPAAEPAPTNAPIATPNTTTPASTPALASAKATTAALTPALTPVPALVSAPVSALVPAPMPAPVSESPTALAPTPQPQPQPQPQPTPITAATPATAAVPAAPLQSASTRQVLDALASRGSAPPPYLDARALAAERAAWQETYLRKANSTSTPAPAAPVSPAARAEPQTPTQAPPTPYLVKPPADEPPPLQTPPTVADRSDEADTIPSTFDELDYAEAQRGAAPPMDHILVVDDSDIALRFMTNNLQRFGFQVHLSRSGQDAIDRVSKRHFEFVFLDVMMEGLDGFQTCKAIKRSTYLDSRPPPTVVMLTSRGTMVDKMRGTMAGCDAYLTKPLIEVELLKIIGDREIAQHDYADTASDSTMTI
jgi:CheY-like chemotaxis protein